MAKRRIRSRFGRIRPAWLRRIVLVMVTPLLAFLFVAVNAFDTARALAKVVAKEAHWQWLDTQIQARRLRDAWREGWEDE